MGGERPVPTFYLGGQPYIYEREVWDGQCDLAREAFRETIRYFDHLTMLYHAGGDEFVSKGEYEKRAIELTMGLWSLRDIIGGDAILYANRSFVIQH